jgi:NAD(P)-dependent dehydrogenase (short-subunit alcohol dehydrogenase family)
VSRRLALVTGGSLGIGKAIAAALLGGGFEVLVSGRDAARLAAARQALSPLGVVHVVRAEQGRAEGEARVIAAAEALGGIDVLVNNLGAFESRGFAQLRDEDWQRLFDTNVMSGVRLSRWALPRMLAGNRGRIIFVASEQAVRPAADMAHYSMTKAAQLSVARALAEMTRGTAVTVNSVMPGPTWTEGVADFVGAMASERGITVDAMKRRFFAEGDWASSLIQRFLDPAEPAAVVAFLASDAASGVNGAAWRAEGGVTRAMV